MGGRRDEGSGDETTPTSDNYNKTSERTTDHAYLTNDNSIRMDTFTETIFESESGDMIKIYIQNGELENTVSAEDILQRYEKLPEVMKEDLNQIKYVENAGRRVGGYYSDKFPGTIHITEATPWWALNHVISHEAAHNWDYKTYNEDINSGRFSLTYRNDMYQAAISDAKDGNPHSTYTLPSEYVNGGDTSSSVSQYAEDCLQKDLRNNYGEDRAESVALYLSNPERFRQDYPNRAAILDKLL
jgi:hypothetical protein